MADPRVLVLHNRYRVLGGEERSVALQLEALEAAGIPHALFERRSSDAGRARAAATLLRGGADPAEVGAAVRGLGATVAHAHNMLPLVGPRGLEAAREAGAKVVLHLHNVRLFCATGIGERDGAPCKRCRGREPCPASAQLPPLAARGRGLRGGAVRAPAAGARRRGPLRDSQRRAADRVAMLGLPRERIETLAHYLPDSVRRPQPGR